MAGLKRKVEIGERYLYGTGYTADTAPCLWGARHTCPSHTGSICPSPGPCYTSLSRKCLCYRKHFMTDIKYQDTLV